MGSSDSRLSDTLASQHLSDNALSGRVILVTGPTAGIGYETARVLAKYGAHVILAARDAAKTETVKQKLIAEIKKEKGESFEPQFTSLSLNLSSLESVRTAANTFLSTGLPLHCLINNAGISGGIDGPHLLTVDGFESTLATNHLGHYYLTKLLLPKLRSTATPDLPARIVTVASLMHHYSAIKKASDIEGLFRIPKEKYSPGPFYNHSKLLNVLHAKALAEQEEKNNILVFSLHPGVVKTDIQKDNKSVTLAIILGVMKPFMKNANQGASTQLYCAIAAPKEQTGKYFADNKVVKESEVSKNKECQKTLMEVSERFIQEWEEKHPLASSASSAVASNDNNNNNNTNSNSILN